MNTQTNPSTLGKLRYIKKARQHELWGEYNIVDIPQAKTWARELGINFVFNPDEFDPETVLLSVRSAD